MNDKVVEQTINWLQSVVIGCNFCPFAAKTLLRKSIRYVVLTDVTLEESLNKFVEELAYLDNTQEIETTLIIFANDFSDFEDYLMLVELAEDVVADMDYEGIYQVASFHPNYAFADATDDDPANYTNRSIYPMLHILREDSITKAVEQYPDVEGIPSKNIAFAKDKGLAYMKMLRDKAFI